MLTWKPKNKFRPYVSASMNKEYMRDNFTKTSLERALRSKGVEVDKRMALVRIIEENYDVLA
tara:strand:+ start:1059 stop:1244 length:186 start_codon:yes stop_codon:yes gene_type:complete